MTNFDEFKLIGSDWVALYVNTEHVTYVDSFGVEHFPKETRKFIRNKNVIANIYRIQVYHTYFWYFCIKFIDFMLKGKRWIECWNFFSPKDFEKNHKITLKYFL